MHKSLGLRESHYPTSAVKKVIAELKRRIIELEDHGL